jgi:hypothetical protein
MARQDPRDLGGAHNRPIGGDAGPATRPGNPSPDTRPLPRNPDDVVRHGRWRHCGALWCAVRRGGHCTSESALANVAPPQVAPVGFAAHQSGTGRPHSIDLPARRAVSADKSRRSRLRGFSGARSRRWRVAMCRQRRPCIFVAPAGSGYSSRNECPCVAVIGCGVVCSRRTGL